MRAHLSLVFAVSILLSFGGLMRAQPTINDNFVSAVTVSAGIDTTLQLIDQSSVVYDEAGQQDARIYEWYTGKQARFDFTNVHVYQLWEGVCAADCNTPEPKELAAGEYKYYPATGTCTVSDLPEPYPASGFFDFLENAHQNGTCSSNGRTGTLWIYQPPTGSPFTEIDLCANGNTPISMSWVGPFSATMTFNTFTPGVPSPANFVPPPACLTAIPTLNQDLFFPFFHSN
ncbi:MAG: hypothetical protein ABSB35_26565 [Bryobacteraceae bacterium]|jgi:hypothetical protein